jgi:hypothetical protein
VLIVVEVLVTFYEIFVRAAKNDLAIWRLDRMLNLYHYWSPVCAQKVRIVLAEKHLDWESVHLDLFEFDNGSPGIWL